MEGLLCSKSLPPGFRFHPTDEELFMYYLKRKVSGKSVSPGMIAEVDVYQFAPWELPPMASLKTRDLNWYFFCPRGKKYPNGGRANRATKLGYWKSTGNDRTMMYNSRPVGKIKTLIFHRGKAPKGDRTDWVMHEYRLEDKVLAEKGVPQESFVICKIYEKSGLGPRNGDHYGARFVEEEWDSDDDDNGQERGLEVVPIPVGICPNGSCSALTTSGGTPNIASIVEFPPADPVADVIHPDISTAFMGTPLTAASAGTQNANPASMSTQNVVPASLGTQNVVPASLGSQNVAPASVGSACAFTSTLASSSTAACDMDEIEMQRLLAYLVEDDCTDIFSGLGDLGFPPGQYDLGWRDHLSMDDLK